MGGGGGGVDGLLSLDLFLLFCDFLWFRGFVVVFQGFGAWCLVFVLGAWFLLFLWMVTVLAFCGFSFFLLFFAFMTSAVFASVSGFFLR